MPKASEFVWRRQLHCVVELPRQSLLFLIIIEINNYFNNKRLFFLITSGKNKQSLLLVSEKQVAHFAAKPLSSFLGGNVYSPTVKCFVKK